MNKRFKKTSSSVPDTFTQSQIDGSSCLEGAAANHAATFKTSEYDTITSTHMFMTISIETICSWNAQAI